ncbi:hypothetical protein NPIL_433051, partial [Nephila pilipes]
MSEDLTKLKQKRTMESSKFIQLISNIEEEIDMESGTVDRFE